MKRYANDYETVTTTDEKGEEKELVVYRGAYFEFDLDEEGIVRFRRNSFLLLAAILILHTSGGFVNNRGMFQFTVALPYVLAFFPLLYMAMGIFRLPKEKRKFRRDEIELSFNRMKTSSNLLLILIGTGILGEIAFLLFVSTESQRALEFLYLGIEVVVAALVFILIHSQRQIHIFTSSEQ